MKALRFENFGDIKSVLRVVECPPPSPGPGEVLIEVHAASINPADVKNVQGSFPQTKLPRIPGRDLAGVVVAGDDAMKGVHVWASGGDIGFTRDGSHAEYIVVPKKGARRKPSSLSMEEAASVGTNYITAYLGLIKKAALKEGETVLVTGASGGVGSSVIKMAKTKAARVIAVDKKPPDKAGLSGIDLALGSDTDDVAKRVMYFTDGRGADVAFDCVGGPLFEPSLNSLGRDGRQINITAVGERRVAFDLLDFYRRRLTLFGVNTALLDTIASGDLLDGLMADFDGRRLTAPRIARTCSLSEAVQAYVDVGSGAAGGKVVILLKT